MRIERENWGEDGVVYRCIKDQGEYPVIGDIQYNLDEEKWMFNSNSVWLTESDLRKILAKIERLNTPRSL